MYKKMIFLLFFEYIESSFDVNSLVRDIGLCPITKNQRDFFFTNLCKWFDQKTKKYSRIKSPCAKDIDVEVYKTDETFNLKIFKNGKCSADCTIDKNDIHDPSSNSTIELVNVCVYNALVTTLTVVVENEDLRLIIFYSRSNFYFVLQTDNLSNLTLTDIISSFIYVNPTQQTAIQRECFFLKRFDAVDEDGFPAPRVSKISTPKSSSDDVFIPSPNKVDNEEQQNNHCTELEPENPERFFTKEVLIVAAIVIGLVFLLLLISIKVFLTK